MIKSILDEIAAEGGSNMKMEILGKYTDNDLLKEVMYLTKSRRVKYFLKQIPEYTTGYQNYTLENAIEKLEQISNREVTGGDAISLLKMILEGTSANDAYVIERIIDKDLKIGMGTSNINKVFPKLIEKTPYMGAKSFSEKLARKIFEGGNHAISQLKADGTYRNAIIRSGEVELLSRQGEVSVLEGAPFLEELSQLSDCVLNGELTIDGKERYEANGMVSSIMDIKAKEEDRGEKATAKKIVAFEEKHGNFEDAINNMRFTVWDMITVDEYFAKKSDTKYDTRAYDLGKILHEADTQMVSIVEGVVVESYEEAMEHFQELLKRGEEGTILKSGSFGWKDGKPNYQVKMKLDISIDLRVIGFEYGEKGTKNENVYSTINLESDCGQLLTNPAGMKEAMMKDITERGEDLIGTIVEIRCSGLSQDSKGNWSTLHPSVVELREDKDTCDSLESAIEIENMAKGLKTV